MSFQEKIKQRANDIIKLHLPLRHGQVVDLDYVLAVYEADENEHTQKLQDLYRDFINSPWRGEQYERIKKNLEGLLPKP